MFMAFLGLATGLTAAPASAAETPLPVYDARELIKSVTKYFSSSSTNRMAGSSPKKRAALPALLKQRGFELGQPVYIRIFKEEKTLELWMKQGDRYALFETYPICKASGKLGPKVREGDKQAPEGFYEINSAHFNPNSNYHLAINMGYPNAYDEANGRTGSYLMIHGACSSVGCYALTDKYIDEVYTLVEAAVRNGQRSVAIHAFPFRMTRENLILQKDSKWIDFWTQDLLPAYDAFEVSGSPPPMMACGKTYQTMMGITQKELPKGCTPITAWK